MDVTTWECFGDTVEQKKKAETHTNIRYVNAKAQVKEIIIVMVIIAWLALITLQRAVTTGTCLSSQPMRDL